MKEKSIEVKVGALVLVCCGLLVGFIFVLGDMGGSGGFTINVDYETASDIKPGAPVKIAGVNAGKVKGIEYWGGKKDPATGRRVIVRVTLNLDPVKGATLHKDAEFFISTQGILGEKYIEVDPGTYEQPFLRAGAVTLGEPPLRMEILGRQLTKVAGSITRILEKNEDVVHNVLVHTDETVLEAKKTVQDADKIIVDNREAVGRVLERLDRTSDKLEKLIAAAESAVGDGKQLKATLKHAESISEKVDVAADPVLKDAKQIAKNLRTLSEKLRDNPTSEVLLGDAGHQKVIRVLDRVDGAMEDVQEVTKNARTGRGTIGGLLMDNELFTDLKLMLKDLKRHPWKFIWRE